MPIMRLRQLNNPRLIDGARKAIRVRRKGLGFLDRVLRAAAAVDQWLRTHFGRPYTALLSIGLVLGIGEAFRKFASELASAQHVNAWAVLGIGLFQGALLINQLAQFHVAREKRRAERAARNGAIDASQVPQLQDVP
jgi:hypothetical protein